MGLGGGSMTENFAGDRLQTNHVLNHYEIRCETEKIPAHMHISKKFYPPKPTLFSYCINMLCFINSIYKSERNGPMATFGR